MRMVICIMLPRDRPRWNKPNVDFRHAFPNKISLYDIEVKKPFCCILHLVAFLISYTKKNSIIFFLGGLLFVLVYVANNETGYIYLVILKNK